ncbi:uncharacterized protein DEA37_0007482 [Paragonimus westermani]|uniref:G-protein coupled receptors family 1 profile domain-containing protein n=1 Tax=Paragonimus westermani TaxID=34504 RepID=A0A5J4NH99_9TREM|nr:uncharacterized protein DEA37_0007482 [Paragonimus westermani]
MVKMLIIVAVMYGLSQLPRHVLYLHGSINQVFWYQSYSIRLWAVATFARDASTCFNPFIYAWVNKNFRKDVYSLFRPLFTLYHTIRRNRFESDRMQSDALRGNEIRSSRRRSFDSIIGSPQAESEKYIPTRSLTYAVSPSMEVQRCACSLQQSGSTFHGN